LCRVVVVVVVVERCLVVEKLPPPLPRSAVILSYVRPARIFSNSLSLSLIRRLRHILAAYSSVEALLLTVILF